MDTSVDETERAVGQRRRFSREYKRQMAEETLTSGASVSVVARRHDVNANQLFRWRKEYREGLLEDAGDLIPIQVNKPAPSVPTAVLETVGGASGSGMDIVLRSGDRVIIRGSADVAVLRTVLEVLGR